MEKNIVEIARKRFLTFKPYMNIDFKTFEGKTVLDVGCAYGMWTQKAQLGGGKTCGMDYSPQWIKEFQYFNPSTPFIVHDIQKQWPFELKFDIVMAIAVLHELKEPEKAIHNIWELANETMYFEIAVEDKYLPGLKKHRSDVYFFPTKEKIMNHLVQYGNVEVLGSGIRWDCKRILFKVDLIP